MLFAMLIVQNGEQDRKHSEPHVKYGTLVISLLNVYRSLYDATISRYQKVHILVKTYH